MTKPRYCLAGTVILTLTQPFKHTYLTAMNSNQDEGVKELAQFFHGCVKVTFEHLSIPLLLFGGRIFDNKNINLLKRTF